MAFNPMQRKVRNSFILGILAMLGITILIGTIVFFAVIKPKMDKKKEEELQLYAYAYRLKAGINVTSGEEITSGMVESVEIPVETIATDFIQSKRKTETGELANIGFVGGYKSKVALTEGTILTYSMLYEEEEMQDSLRFVEYNMITMPTLLDVGNYVDIRLRLPNGQDLIVTSKKEIISIYGQSVGMYLTEEEILILNSAIVEAYIMSASELYMATYVEPGIQTAAIYTYMPTNEVRTLMNMDENIVSEAKQMLATIYTKEGTVNVRNQVDSNVSQYRENASTEYSLDTKVQEQIEAARTAREQYLAELAGY